MLPGSARRRAAFNALCALVPEMVCKGLCQQACTSPIDIIPTEAAILGDVGTLILSANPKNHGLQPKKVTLGACVALDGNGRCTVYKDRPFMCRIWGAVSFMACAHGCVPEGGFMGDVEALQAIIGWSLIDETAPERVEFGQFMRQMMGSDVELQRAFIYRVRVYSNREETYTEADCVQADVLLLQALDNARDRALARNRDGGSGGSGGPGRSGRTGRTGRRRPGKR